MTTTVTQTSSTATPTAATTVLADYVSTIFSTTTALVGTGAIIQKGLLFAAGYAIGHKRGGGTWY